jgi:hypothetical protein
MATPAYTISGSKRATDASAWAMNCASQQKKSRIAQVLSI